MGRPDLGALIARTMAPPEEDRTIEVITGEILEAKRTGGEAILTIGRCLIEAKDMLSHGEWLPWLNERVEFSERTARRFMQLYRECSNRPALADLGAAKALALLALPAEEREQFISEPHQVDGEEKNVVDMTSRQLQQAIKERDEACRAAEQARADASAAERARAKMAEDMAMANSCLEGARAEKRAADEEITRLSLDLEELKARPVEVAVETVVDQEAIDKARAEAVAGMQAKLDKAKEAAAKARDKQKQAEASVEILKRSLEERDKAEKKAAMAGDKELAQFEVLFLQCQELANKLHGLLLKTRGREDPAAARGMEKALRTLAEAIGRCAD